MRKCTHPTMVKRTITALLKFILSVTPRKVSQDIQNWCKLILSLSVLKSIANQMEESEGGCKHDRGWHDTHESGLDQPQAHMRVHKGLDSAVQGQYMGRAPSPCVLGMIHYCDKTSWAKATRGLFVILYFQVIVYHWGEWEQEPKAGTEVETMEQCSCLLVCKPSHSPQGLLSPPTLIINQENAC